MRLQIDNHIEDYYSAFYLLLWPSLSLSHSFTRTYHLIKFTSIIFLCRHSRKPNHAHITNNSNRINTNFVQCNNEMIYPHTRLTHSAPASTWNWKREREQQRKRTTNGQSLEEKWKYTETQKKKKGIYSDCLLCFDG